MLVKPLELGFPSIAGSHAAALTVIASESYLPWPISSAAATILAWSCTAWAARIRTNPGLVELPVKSLGRELVH